MKIFNNFDRIFICLVFINIYCYVTVECFDVEVVKTANEVLSTGSELLSNVDHFISPLKAFQKISTFLGNLGPAAMAVSSIISLVTMFLPQEDSPELKAIKEGFNKVNNRLDIITSKIGSLEDKIELSSAKASFISFVTVINSNSEALEDARKVGDKDSMDYFVKQFKNTFNLATDKIYDALVGTHGSLGFNVVNLYRIHVKCNPQLLSDFCTKGLQLIIKGMNIEGAYLGYNNLTNLAKTKSLKWENKMKNLVTECSSKIEHCENNWKEYAYIKFKETYKEIGGDNQNFADRLAKDLENVVPQRSWLTVVYNDATVNGEHAYSSNYEMETRWDESGHDVSIVSTPKQPQLTGQEYDDFVKLIEAQKSSIYAITDCWTRIYWLIPAKRYRYDEARVLVEQIRKAYYNGFVNIVSLSYNVGVSVTGNTLHLSEIHWQCASPFKLIIFQ